MMFRFPAITSRSDRSEFRFKKDISIISMSKTNQFTDYGYEDRKSQGSESNVKEFCSTCRAENPSFARFCFFCGTRLTSVNKEFDAQGVEKLKMRVKEDLLRKMGKNRVSIRNPLVQNCPRCGMENLAFSKYCHNCNSSLLNKKI
jgi:predicted amidophosphoribosyltransferase